jgi:hypothetical protein
MEQKFNSPSTESNEKKKEKIAFPHGEEATRLFEKEYPGNPDQVKKVEDIFNTFFKQEMENIAIYKSKEGVEYPYTNINTANLAKELYKKYSGKKLPENLVVNTEQPLIKREFVLESFLTTTNGSPFTFCEEAMHQAVMNLPRAIENLKKGIEPENVEVYTLGSPTNLLGKMTPKFYEDLKGEPFKKLGEIYAELIKEKIGSINNDSNAKTFVELYGISMGAGIAAMTGEKLLEDEKFTQEKQPNDTKDKKVEIDIRAVLPVTLSRSTIKKIQIPIGFLYDSIKGLITNPYVRKVGGGEGDFIKKVNTELAKRGIHENMDKEQKEMKEKSMPRLIFALGKGLTLKPETKVNEIYGLRDSTTITPSLKFDAMVQKEEHPDTIGSTIIPGKRDGSRTFVANATHAEIPAANFNRQSEQRRIKAAAESLDNL